MDLEKEAIKTQHNNIEGNMVGHGHAKQPKPGHGAKRKENSIAEIWLRSTNSLHLNKFDVSRKERMIFLTKHV